MTNTLSRVRAGLLVLVSVFVLATIGYHFLDGRDWLDSVYMVVITISTVGFGETSGMSNVTKTLTVFVILLGLTASAYTFTAFIQHLAAGELHRYLGQRRMTTEISRLSGHVIVCGFGRIGQLLSGDLAHVGRSFVVVEQDEDRVKSAIEEGYLVTVGDADGGGRVDRGGRRSRNRHRHHPA